MQTLHSTWLSSAHMGSTNSVSPPHHAQLSDHFYYIMVFGTIQVLCYKGVQNVPTLLTLLGGGGVQFLEKNINLYHLNRPFYVLA